MKKHYTNPETGISYTLCGDYYLPDFAFPEEDNLYIGVYGNRHRRHLENHQPVMYWELLVSGRLCAYLADIDEQARGRLEFLVERM